MPPHPGGSDHHDTAIAPSHGERRVRLAETNVVSEQGAPMCVEHPAQTTHRVALMRVKGDVAELSAGHRSQDVSRYRGSQLIRI
jgi:hypothetical protein